jgi:flagella basal body P-ring formation protein FlgA
MNSRPSHFRLSLLLASALGLAVRLGFAAAPAEPAGSTVSAPAAEAAAPFTREQIQRELTRALAAHFNLEGDLQLELPRGWNAPTQLATQWNLEVTDYPSLASSAMMVRCRIYGDGQTVSDSSLVLRATHLQDVWVARQPVNAGAVFDPAELEVRRVDLFRERDSLPASVGDNKFVYTRSIPAGRLLCWRDLARRPLVRKGDLVEVSAGEGQLLVTLKAVALENGAQGDVVTLRNPESRKDFIAVVTHENHVQVRF